LVDDHDPPRHASRNRRSSGPKTDNAKKIPAAAEGRVGMRTRNRAFLSSIAGFERVSSTATAMLRGAVGHSRDGLGAAGKLVEADLDRAMTYHGWGNWGISVDRKAP
jgi:hypothetical protein